jgi:hypothetical protein
LLTPDFQDFVADGDLSEWDVVAPVATRYADETTFGLRLFSDRDSLNVLLEGIENSFYTVFLNTDEMQSTGVTDEIWAGSGFDYCIRNDSLFQAQGQSWNFLEKVSSALGSNGLEVSIPLSRLENLGANIRIKTTALLAVDEDVLVHLPFAGEPPSTYIRLLPALTPQSLAVSNSQATPESRLVIEWQSGCLYCKGYVLERSNTPESGFTEIFRTSLASLYRDDNLEVNKTYYYRIYSFNETGKSDYSAVMSGTTYNDVTGIDDPEQAVKVYPVPVDNMLTIQTEQRLYSVSMTSAMGNVLHPHEVEHDVLLNQMKIDLSALPPGVYILWITAGDRKFPYKILKR